VSAALSSSNLAASGAALVSNYALPTTVDGNIGIITPKALTVALQGAVSRAYDGTTLVSLSADNFNVTGLVANEGLTLNSATGNFASKDVGTGLNVTTEISQVSFQPNSGTLLSNYIIPTSASGTIGEITPKALTVALTGTASKAYDGLLTVSLASNNYLLSGVGSGDSLTVNQSQGTLASKDAGTNIAVSTTIAPADFVAGSGTLLSNYVLPSTQLSGNIGTVNPKMLTVSLIGTTSRVYDGSLNATLTSQNFSLSGFVGDDQLTVTQAQGLYLDKNVGTQISVSAALSSSNLAASGAALVSNYALPTTVDGNIGIITPKALTVA
ncbi:MAG: hypothetical protein CFE32_20545, partial [Alphaproteobacteria bacterium PA3]